MWPAGIATLRSAGAEGAVRHGDPWRAAGGGGGGGGDGAGPEPEPEPEPEAGGAAAAPLAAFEAARSEAFPGGAGLFGTQGNADLLWEEHSSSPATLPAEAVLAGATPLALLGRDVRMPDVRAAYHAAEELYTGISPLAFNCDLRSAAAPAPDTGPRHPGEPAPLRRFRRR